MTSRLSRWRDVGVALAVVGLVISWEYLFRHYVLFWLPVFGTLSVNDMLALFLAYVLLLVGVGLFVHVDWPQESAALVRSLREGLTGWPFTRLVLALMAAVWAISRVDRLLWGHVELPMVVSSYRNPVVWLANLAPVLKVVSLILVNGLFVPVAEEYLWRGLVQVRLLHALPAPYAIGVTAVLFSLKHALVDASLGRLLALTAFGAITGVVARRNTWRLSAALHLVVNTLATAFGLVFALT